ncbi:FG-GAP repeat domain-containing protein [Nocardioides sp.]|uniref:FG-GAP repeat domain-containing protein n=1 Tax=Nocardioides sp. TaxID=35761 RepID=UPI0035673AA8
MIRSPFRRALLVSTAIATALTTTTFLAPGAKADPPVDPVIPASFSRVDIDAGITGAAFTAAGSVYGSETDLVTSAFGAFVPGVGGPPTPPAAGTVQLYRPGANIGTWTKVTVFDTSAAITFPNQPTIADVDGDDDNDILVPGGYFFDTYDPPGPSVGQDRGSLTWWENTGEGNAFVRHDILTAQPWAFHGAEFADLDGDGNDDIVTVGEQGKSPSDPSDDLVSLQFLAGNGDGTFAAPVELDTAGGSLPVVIDVDGDDRLDIVSAQYFGFPSGPGAVGMPSFQWWQQGGTIAPGGLDAGNFTKHAIANFENTAYGFQIRPIPDLHGDGKIGWVGTNHMSKLGPGGNFIPAYESVYEFTPGTDVTQPWAVTTLSNPADPADKMAARSAAGSLAPGVFGYGDIDGDGDIDLAVSGDGDEKVVGNCASTSTCARRLFWIEQGGDGTFVQHTLTGPTERFGQAGGAIVTDLDGDGANELAFSSFEQNTLAVWTRQGGGASQESSAITGFKTKTKKVKKASVQLKDPIAVAPGAGRTVLLQFRTCKPSSSTCAWKTYQSYASRADGKVVLRYRAQGKKSFWRVLVEETPAAAEATSAVRKVVLKKKK